MPVNTEKIKEILESYPADQHYSLAIMQDLQHEFQYIPREGLEALADYLSVPLSSLYSMATFYKALSLKPKGKHIIKLCDGTACHIRGSMTLVEGITRAVVDECISEENFLSVAISRIEEHVIQDELSIEDKAQIRVLQEAFTEYAALTQQITDEVVDKTLRSERPEVMVDRIANELMVPVPKKQKVLESLLFTERVKILNGIHYDGNPGLIIST